MRRKNHCVLTTGASLGLDDASPFGDDEAHSADTVYRLASYSIPSFLSDLPRFVVEFRHRKAVRHRGQPRWRRSDCHLVDRIIFLRPRTSRRRPFAPRRGRRSSRSRTLGRVVCCIQRAWRGRKNRREPQLFLPSREANGPYLINYEATARVCGARARLNANKTPRRLGGAVYR